MGYTVPDTAKLKCSNCGHDILVLKEIYVTEKIEYLKIQRDALTQSVIIIEKKIDEETQKLSNMRGFNIEG